MLVTLAKFESTFGLRYVYRDRPIAECSFGSEDYQPAGGTPLMDAVGDVINGAKISKTGKTLLAIFTDGQENDSKRFTKNKVKALIEKQDPARFQVLYLGVALDNFDDAMSMGLMYTNYRGYSTFTAGTQAMASSGSTRTWFNDTAQASLDISEEEVVTP
jgi:hypothetical protein